MNNTILITGADGFLGGKITKHILENTEFNVLGLTMSLDLPPKMLEREDIKETGRISFMTNEEFLNPETVINDIYGVVHLAFSRRMQPAKDIASSIDFAASVFHRLVSLDADRVINMSSQGVYGNTEEIRTEETPVAPATQYTMAKYAAEVLFNDILCDIPHHTNFRLDPVAQSQNVIRGLCNSALEGKISLKGGKQVFSFIDANDIGSAVTAMLTADGKWDTVYNVGWNRIRYTLIELAELVAVVTEQAGYDRPVIQLEENDTELWAGMDSSKFTEKTEWQPVIGIGDSIKQIIKMQGIYFTS